ncbi:MAG: hypothetical protein M0R51_14010 [Clostridia bacterium]|jgi:hypothetical protein|nr:hypothetical protein [Clostridia bacterium]
MAKEIRIMEFSGNTDNSQIFNSIVSNNAKLAAARAYKEYGRYGLIEEVVVENYKQEDSKAKEAVLAFASSVAGIETPTNTDTLAFAFDNNTFKTVVNSIYSKTLSTMMINYRSPQIDALAQRDRVPVGGSMTYPIKSKALPIAQRGSYGSNNSSVFTEATGSIVVTPVPYVIGKSLDYIRMFNEGYDWSYDVAKVYAGLMFAKYKLIVDSIYTNAAILASPFYQANFADATYTQLASDLSMYAGNDAITAYGTLPAWQAIDALATSGGFTTKDEYIRNAFLQKVLGVDSMILSQFTDASAPFTSGTAAGLRTIPDNKVILVPTGTDKICKLVEEQYIRVKEVDANDNNLNRMEFVFTQSFEAKIATASPFGIVGTTAASE